MTARVRYSKDVLQWGNAVKQPLDIDWPAPSSSFRGDEQTHLGELKPALPTATAIDESALAWINEAKLKKSTLENRLAEIEKKLELLTNLTEMLEPKEITIRDISYAQAKKEITEYFKTHHGDSIDPADIEESLGIDIEIAIKICEKLEKEGQIKGI